MNRREFLKGLGAAIVGAVIPRRKGSDSPPTQVEQCDVLIRPRIILRDNIGWASAKFKDVTYTPDGPAYKFEGAPIQEPFDENMWFLPKREAPATLDIVESLQVVKDKVDQAVVKGLTPYEGVEVVYQGFDERPSPLTLEQYAEALGISPAVVKGPTMFVAGDTGPEKAIYPEVPIVPTLPERVEWAWAYGDDGYMLSTDGGETWKYYDCPENVGSESNGYLSIPDDGEVEWVEWADVQYGEDRIWATSTDGRRWISYDAIHFYEV